MRYSRAEKLQLGPAKLGKAQQLWAHASEKRRAAPRVPAPLLATRRTSAEPLDARAPPARARHPRAAPALFAAARGVGRRAPLSRHLAVQRPRPARGRLRSLPAGAAASGRPRDGAASAQRGGRSRSRPVLLIGGRSLPARSAGSALMGAGRPELGLGRRRRGLGARGDAGSPPSVRAPPPAWSAGSREVAAPSWRRGWWPRLECSAGAGRAIPGLRRLRPAPRRLPAPRSPRPRATPLRRAPPRRRTGPRTCLQRRGLRAHQPAGSAGTEHSNLAWTWSADA